MRKKISGHKCWFSFKEDWKSSFCLVARGGRQMWTCSHQWEHNSQFFWGHPVNVQLYQDFQNPVWGWLLVATILLFPKHILSSLASSFRAEISVSLQECYYWGPSWPTLIHWVPSQPTVLPHLCPSSHPLSCEASSDLESSLNPVFSVWPGLEQACTIIKFFCVICVVVDLYH